MTLKNAFHWFGCHTMLLVLCLWPSIGVLHAGIGTVYDRSCTHDERVGCDVKCSAQQPIGPGIFQGPVEANCTHYQHWMDPNGPIDWRDGVSCTCQSVIQYAPDLVTGTCFSTGNHGCVDPARWDPFTCRCILEWVTAPEDHTYVQIAYDYDCGDGTTDPNEQCDFGPNNVEAPTYGNVPCDTTVSRTRTICLSDCTLTWECVPE